MVVHIGIASGVNYNSIGGKDKEWLKEFYNIREGNYTRLKRATFIGTPQRQRDCGYLNTSACLSFAFKKSKASFISPQFFRNET